MKVISHIRQVAESRGIENAFQLWKRIGGSKEKSAQLWGGEFKMLGMGTLAKLCRELECQVGDLLVYERGGEKKRKHTMPTKRGHK
jgi:DNA-binding Xre family transcriptional regulator